jgi:two-component system sensor histidine kinase AlgZ
MNKLMINPSIQSEESLFLPDFCNGYTIFLVVILTELLAFVLVLVPLNKPGYDWDYITTSLMVDLAMISWFMQWVALLSIGLLCLVRHRLSKLGNDALVGFLSYLLVLTVTALVSESAWQVKNLVAGVPWHDIHTQHWLFLLRNLGISAIISAIVLRYFYMQHQWKKQTEAHAYAQTQALQARIRPHFLFNSMNTIASLIRFNPELAEQAVEDLADIFRASLSDTRKLVTWRDELTLCLQYSRIEALRFRERLQVVWQTDKIPEDALLPPLCLQPLLENAIRHGIQSLPEGGTIDINGQFDGKFISLEITNPIAEEWPSPHQGNQMAQLNIKQRLQVYYGGQAYLKVQNQNQRYQVILRFPYQNQYHENYYRR